MPGWESELRWGHGRWLVSIAAGVDRWRARGTEDQSAASLSALPPGRCVPALEKSRVMGQTGELVGCICGNRGSRASAFPFPHPVSWASASAFGSLGIMPCVWPSPREGRMENEVGPSPWRERVEMCGEDKQADGVEGRGRRMSNGVGESMLPVCAQGCGESCSVIIP